MKLIKIIPNKTYATEANAIKAVEKAAQAGGWRNHLRYFIALNEEGRFFPVIVGLEGIQDGVHFHFNVVG